MKDNLFIRYFEWEEMRCYRSAKTIVVVTDSFKRTLVARGIDEAKIKVVKNGVDKEMFRPVPKDEALVKELGLEGKKIIGYIGTHGMAHKLDFILDCAKNMQGRNDFHFLLIGAGAEREALLAKKETEGIGNVTMLDSVPKDQVVRYISILDLSLINLRKSDLFKTVIPSKMFESAGMQIPIIMGVQGEAEEMIAKYGAGLCFEPENEADFNAKLEQLLADPDLYDRCRKGGLELSSDYDRKVLAAMMLDCIRATVSI